MELNFSKLAIAAGFSLGMISLGSVAEAGMSMQGTQLQGMNLSGQTAEAQIQKQSKSLFDYATDAQIAEGQTHSECEELTVSDSSSVEQTSEKMCNPEGSCCCYSSNGETICSGGGC